VQGSNTTHVPSFPGENSQSSPNLAQTFEGIGRVSLRLGQPSAQSARKRIGCQRIASLCTQLLAGAISPPHASRQQPDFKRCWLMICGSNFELDSYGFRRSPWGLRTVF
jgi:hypothetical protein